MNQAGLSPLDGGRSAAPSSSRAAATQIPPKVGLAKPARDAEPTQTVAPDAKAASSQTVDLEALQKLVAEINLKVPQERGIRFDVSGEGSDLVVQVVDKGSDEVIREIPPDRLRGLRSFFQDLTGALVDDRA